jgi:hypothetical protein
MAEAKGYLSGKPFYVHLQQSRLSHAFLKVKRTHSEELFRYVWLNKLTIADKGSHVIFRAEYLDQGAKFYEDNTATTDRTAEMQSRQVGISRC